MKKLKPIGIFLLLTILSSCGGNENIKSPVDMLIRDMPTKATFSVVLHDMDVEGNFFSTYKHQYKIITELPDALPEEEETGWYEVSASEFKRYQDDMGMEIASKGADGKLVKSVSPPGYANYVGNQKYGRWENRGGSSFWAFYGQYAFMSSMFRMSMYPISRSYYNDYRGNYYGTGRSYYGPTTNGRTMYGTNSQYNSSAKPNSSWSRNNSSFKQRVAGRTSRSSSRYSSTSSRSRGGGYGK